MSGSEVWTSKKGFVRNTPTSMKAAMTSSSMKMPLTALLLTFSKFFWPRERERKALMPTARPTAKEIIRVWMGKARLTAVRAFSLIIDTKMESTML